MRCVHYAFTMGYYWLEASLYNTYDNSSNIVVGLGYVLSSKSEYKRRWHYNVEIASKKPKVDLEQAVIVGHQYGMAVQLLHEAKLLNAHRTTTT